jgi:hypothetical protein
MIGAPVFRYVLTPGWAGDSLARAAQAVPSLDLNFAVTKNLGPLVTFTRASSATFIDSAGTLQTAAVDVPRFGHNPTTGESLGLLVEEARTNLVLRSEEFDNASWAKAFVTTTPNTTTAPDGTITADSVTPNTATTLFYTLQNVTTTTSTIYTWSVYVKANGFSWIFLDAVDGSNHRTWFDIANGTIGTVEAGNTSTIAAVGNGWYRCTLTRSSAGGSVAYAVAIVSGNNSLNATGNSSNGVFLWGAQLEAGAFPTSYIPTTTAAVTRSADVATITSIGSNVRSLFAQFRSPASGTRPVVSLDDNTANERIEVLTSGADPKLLVTDGGSAVADLNGGTVTANVTARAAAAFDTNNYAFSVDGGASQLDSSGTLPTVNRIRIGSNQAGGYLNGTIARATGWDVALPNLPPVTQ